MPALELLVGFVTAPSTTFTALGMGAGNTLTVRNAKEGSRARLLAAWADNQTAGQLRIRSPRMHDNVQGMRLHSVASSVYNLLPQGPSEKLFPQDVITAELTGSATSGDIESAAMLVYYDDLPGVEARLIDYPTLMARAKHILTIENTLVLGTAGGYSGEEALNAEIDLLKANVDYAILGYLVSAECVAVRWRGADFGNLGVGGPGNELAPDITSEFFINLSVQHGLPLIPVFNASNKGSILIDGAQDENGTDVLVTTILAELSPA